MATAKHVPSLTLVGPDVPSENAERLVEEMTPKQVRQMVADLPDEWLLCRRVRHAWQPLSAARMRGGGWEILRCSRCGAEKEHQYDRHGNRTYTGQPTYPDGYLFTGQGRMGKDGRLALTHESLRRTYNSFKEE